MVFAAPSRAIAEIDLPEPPLSMGQPDQLRISWGAVGGYDFEKEVHTSRLFFEILPEAFIPQIGFGRLTAEAGAGFSGEEVETALAARLRIPFFAAGVEFNSLDQRLTTDLVLQFAARRQGFLGIGDQLRIGYRPTDQEVVFGMVFDRPFRRYRPTRPRSKHAPIQEATGDQPEPVPVESLPPDLARTLDAVGHSIEWLDRLLTPRFLLGDKGVDAAEAYREHIRMPGHAFADEDASYHRELRAAFTIAAGGDSAAGEELGRTAEAIILRRVVAPYNQRFGQKKDPLYPDGFIEEAYLEFAGRLDGEAGIAPADSVSRLARVVFRRVLDEIGEAARAARERWKWGHFLWEEDARLAWLPLNYGLRPEQYDSQAEWDSVLALVTAKPFTDANTIDYFFTPEFHPELKRLIRETVDYQVTIIHDFRGRQRKNITDAIGWDVVTDGYIRGFIEAIRDLDAGSRARLPQYIAFIDENYYQDNKSRELVTFIENLYDGPIESGHLKNREIESRVRAAHRELRAAIGSSPAFKGMKDGKLRPLFKVHVSVTNPHDNGFVLDADKRDHRKIAFRDVREDDPASGEGILTGQGIGDHYNGPRWEDRSLRLRGPALLELKQLAERLFRSQGYRPFEVPACLETRPVPADYGERCRALRAQGWTTPILIAVNETGYGAKEATVLKAALFNLAPPGAVLFSFDSLWISDFWAGMFAGAAARGARVHAVAPTAANAPSDAHFTLALMRDNLDLMARARGYFADEIARTGGDLRVGIYTQEFGANDLARCAKGFCDGLDENAFLRDLMPSDPGFLRALREGLATEGAAGSDSLVRPRMHLKLTFLADREAVDYLSGGDGAPVYRQRWRGWPEAAPDGDAAPVAPAPAEGIFTLTMGSQNQDRRGMISDGEVLAAVSGPDALAAWLDVLYLAATAEWPATAGEFEAAFPVQERSGGWKRFFRLFQDLI